MTSNPAELEPITLALLYGTLAFVAAIGILVVNYWLKPRKDVRVHPEFLSEEKRAATTARLRAIAGTEFKRRP